MRVVPESMVHLGQLSSRGGDVITLKIHQKIITAESGQDVTLTCRAPNNNIIIVLEWSRADLGDEYVLFYRDEEFDPEYQHPSFKNRVDLQDRQMKDGDVSLILKNVTINDTGTYECRVVQRGTKRRKRAVLDGDPISIITLKVDPPGQTGGPVGLIVGLIVPAVLLVAVVGLLIYRRCKLNPADPHVAEHLQLFMRFTDTKSNCVTNTHEFLSSDLRVNKNITAESGQDVTLTCRAVNNESEKMSQQLHQPEVDPTQTETSLSV
ncbi:unnamed protein product [Oreochromis niloticus]|nr:unnamed protein product [Mustela putorius furo]